MTKLSKPTWRALAWAFPFAAILIVRMIWYLPFLSDDALISLRYARRLLDGYGLTWTAGHPVEGYSNLLWVLLVALVGRFHVDLIDAARLLGALGMVSCVFALAWWYARRARGLSAWLTVAVPLLFLALSAPMAVWAIGGLEQPLIAGLLAASVPLAYGVLDRTSVDYGRTMWLSVVLGLLCLTRPDSPIFAAAAAGAVLAGGWIDRRPAPVRHAALVLLCPVVFTLAQLGFRLAYYGEFLPNTALVKIALSSARRTAGLAYLSDGFAAAAPFSYVGVVALVAILAAGRSRSKGIYLALAAVAWSGYVVFIGGDIFPAYRQLVPLVIILAFAIAEGAELLAAWFAPRRLILVGLAAAGALACIPYVRAQSSDRWIHRAVTERWEWQGRELALLLKHAFGPSQPVVAVTAAGCIPYWSELPSIDTMGLNDYYLPRHRPASFGTGMIGHELGDGAYVLGLKPDLMVFDVGSPEPSWRTGDELKTMTEFRERYVAVSVPLSTADEAAVFFADKYSERIGITSTADRLTIPGFLLTGPGVVSVPDGSGALVARLTAGQSASVSIKAAPGVIWDVDDSQLATVGATGEVDQRGDALTITLHARRESTGVASVTLKRR